MNQVLLAAAAACALLIALMSSGLNCRIVAITGINACSAQPNTHT